MGPPPPKVVAEVPDPLEDPNPEVGDEELPKVPELPLCDPIPEVGDPKLEPEDPNVELELEDPNVELDPKLEPDEAPGVFDWSGLAMGTPFASVVVEAATAYMEEPPVPPMVMSGCPKKPRGRTCAWPKRMGFQSALPVSGSVYFLRRKRSWLVSTSWSTEVG
jgi:hypothetical protein